MLWCYLHFSRNPWAVVTMGGTCGNQASSENVGEVNFPAVAEASLKGACNATCTWRERISGFLAFSKSTKESLSLTSHLDGSLGQTNRKIKSKNKPAFRRLVPVLEILI